MKKKISLLLVFALLVTLFTACGNTQEETTEQKGGEELVVAMELAYPPFETKDENGDPSGVSVDFSTVAFNDRNQSIYDGLSTAFGKRPTAAHAEGAK